MDNNFIDSINAKIENLTAQYNACTRKLKIHGFNENIYDERAQLGRCISALNVVLREFSALENKQKK